MQITPPHGRDTSDKIFLNCEYSGTDTAGRGDLMTFDLTDNRSQAGIEVDTWGQRVVRHQGTEFWEQTSAGILETEEVPGIPAPDAVNGAMRGKMCLVQCYGYHDQARYGGGSIAAGLGYILPHNATVGAMTCQTKTVIDTVGSGGTVSNASYVASQVGWNFENSGSTFAQKGMFVKCMG